MDRRQAGLAAGLALLCAVLWLMGDTSTEKGSNLSDMGALGLLTVAVVVVVRLVSPQRD